MKAKVFVSPKQTVLDPQGKAIQAALHGLGFDVSDVRQGKVFDITLRPGVTADQAREQLDRMSRDVLANPVIEEFTWQLLD